MVKIGGVHIPRQSIQTRNHCTVGDKALAEVVSWGTSLGGKLVGCIHTHPGHEPVLSALDVITLNTIRETPWSIIPEGGLAVGIMQSWTSSVDGVACTPLKGGLKAYTMSALGTEVANKCAAIRRKTPGVEHQYHEHIAGVWDDDDPHPVWRAHEEVPLVLEEMEEGGCMDMGNNKWWTKWLGVGSSPQEMGSTKPNIAEESDGNTTATRQQAQLDQKPGRKSAGPSMLLDYVVDR